MRNLGLLPAILEDLPFDGCDVQTLGRDLGVLQALLCFEFAQPQLLRVALTHPTWVAEAGDDNKWPSQACLEFLGDAVVDLHVADAVWRKFPALDEGALTRLRATLVSEAGLAAIARRLDLSSWILLGSSAKSSNLALQDVVLADTVEAIAGAAFLDARASGKDALVSMARMLDCLFGEQIRHLHDQDGHDPKSLLQNRVQAAWKATPFYQSRVDDGQTVSQVRVLHPSGRELVLGHGEGRNRRESERAAAQDALTRWPPVE